MLFPFWLVVFCVQMQIGASEYDEQFAMQMFAFSYCAYSSSNRDSAKSPDYRENVEKCVRGETFGVGADWQIEVAKTQKCDNYGNGCSFLIASSARQRLVVVAFKGTTTFEQFVVETVQRNRCVPLDASHPNKGYVNAYFQRALTCKWNNTAGEESISAQIVAQLEQQHVDKDSPETLFAFTGHSLGGALAALVALKFQEKIKMAKIRHYSFGQPMVGCPEFARHFDNEIPESPHLSHRVVHGNDIVPQLPPKFLANSRTKCNPNREDRVLYRHHGRKQWYKARIMPCAVCTIGEGVHKKCPLGGCTPKWLRKMIKQIRQNADLSTYVYNHFNYFQLSIQDKVHLLNLMNVLEKGERRENVKKVVREHWKRVKTNLQILLFALRNRTTDIFSLINS